MLSESARMSSAAEARFRVQSPNSRPRAVKVLALDAAGEAVVKRLSDGPWRDATFLLAFGSSVENGRITDLSGRVRSLEEEVDGADLVVMIAAPGGRAHAAAAIGEACSRRRIMTTALIVDGASADDLELSKTLGQVRPWSLMVVLAGSDDYVDDMLTALRA